MSILGDKLLAKVVFLVAMDVVHQYTRQGEQTVLCLTWPLVSNASQSAVPVGRRPIDRHFHNPTDSVSTLHATYTNFCNGSVLSDVAPDDVGANGANAAPTILVLGWSRRTDTAAHLYSCQ